MGGCLLVLKVCSFLKGLYRKEHYRVPCFLVFKNDYCMFFGEEKFFKGSSRVLKGLERSKRGSTWNSS